MTVEDCTFGSTTLPKITLHELADMLLEIKRYVKLDPEYVVRELENLDRSATVPDLVTLQRFFQLVENINVGAICIHADPEVLECYLYAAAFEIRAAALREENANA